MVLLRSGHVTAGIDVNSLTGKVFCLNDHADQGPKLLGATGSAQRMTLGMRVVHTPNWLRVF